jgi:formylglycine-generating enzyme required for sulfatase activity
VNSIGMKLAWIPAGEFRMGSTAADVEKVLAFDSTFKPQHADDEQPQHKVRIGRPFYLGAHEVTRGEFARFVKETNYVTEAEADGQGGWGYNPTNGKLEGPKPEYTWRNTGFAQDDTHPVVNVSWNDALAFCQWLSAREKREYRLPTEAEWEYACRDGSATAYQNSDEPEALVHMGNVADGVGKAKFATWNAIAGNDGYVFTAPVGRFADNSLGLFDMHGNVWEWCSDWYLSDYYKKSPSVDPHGPASGSNRVTKGGSWGSAASYSRAAYRRPLGPSYRDYGLGFRVAVSSVP